MSHGTTVTDDIFDDEQDVKFGDKEWDKMKVSLTKDGLREGINEGQELALQTGFNIGFHNAAEISFKMAELRGCLSALIGHNLTGGSSLIPDSLREEFEGLLEQTADLEARFYALKPQQEKDQNQPQTESCKGNLEAHKGIEKSECKCAEFDSKDKGVHVSCCKSNDSTCTSCNCKSIEHEDCSMEAKRTSDPSNELVYSDFNKQYDLPENLSKQYVKEFEKITQRFNQLQEVCNEKFKSMECIF